MQLIGRPFDEATLFRAGAAFQEATDFHLRAAGSLTGRRPNSLDWSNTEQPEKQACATN